MLNLLADMTAGEFGKAVIQGVIGFIIVFLGIIVLIAILSLVGFIMNKTASKGEKKTDETDFANESVEPELKTNEVEELPDEIKAAVIAAVMAYYKAEKPQAEFIVKRIKRI